MMPFPSRDDGDLVQFLRRHNPSPPPPPAHQEDQLMAQLVATGAKRIPPAGIPAWLPLAGILALAVTLGTGVWWSQRPVQWAHPSPPQETWEAFLLHHWWAVTEPPNEGTTSGDEWLALTQFPHP